MRLFCWEIRRIKYDAESIEVELPAELVARVIQRNRDKKSTSRSLLNQLCKAIGDNFEEEIIKPVIGIGVMR